jgi:hypothetical protein
VCALLDSSVVCLVRIVRSNLVSSHAAQFDYKSIGVFYSHNLSGMPGGVTRLLACDEEQLKHYKGLNIGPTLVHKNYARVSHIRELGPGETKQPYGAAARDSSPSYNKPGSIMHWVKEAPEAKHVDYVLYIDADMLLRLVRCPRLGHAHLASPCGSLHESLRRHDA